LLVGAVLAAPQESSADLLLKVGDASEPTPEFGGGAAPDQGHHLVREPHDVDVVDYRVRQAVRIAVR
jgi:hypothetical protein